MSILIVITLITGGFLWWNSQQWQQAEDRIVQTFPKLLPENRLKRGWDEIKCTGTNSEQQQSGITTLNCANRKFALSVRHYSTNMDRDLSVNAATNTSKFSFDGKRCYADAVIAGNTEALILFSGTLSEYAILIQSDEVKPILNKFQYAEINMLDPTQRLEITTQSGETKSFYPGTSITIGRTGNTESKTHIVIGTEAWLHRKFFAMFHSGSMWMIKNMRDKYEAIIHSDELPYLVSQLKQGKLISLQPGLNRLTFEISEKPFEVQLRVSKLQYKPTELVPGNANDDDITKIPPGYKFGEKQKILARALAEHLEACKKQGHKNLPSMRDLADELDTTETAVQRQLEEIIKKLKLNYEKVCSPHAQCVAEYALHNPHLFKAGD